MQCVLSSYLFGNICNHNLNNEAGHHVSPSSKLPYGHHISSSSKPPYDSTTRPSCEAGHHVSLSSTKTAPAVKFQIQPPEVPTSRSGWPKQKSDTQFHQGQKLNSHIRRHHGKDFIDSLLPVIVIVQVQNLGPPPTPPPTPERRGRGKRGNVSLWHYPIPDHLVLYCCIVLYFTSPRATVSELY